MKEQRFEKVVKYGEEPNYPLMMLCLIFALLLDSSFFIQETSKILSFFVGLVNGLFIFGIIFSFGKGRKVYWRKI